MKKLLRGQGPVWVEPRASSNRPAVGCMRLLGDGQSAACSPPRHFLAADIKQGGWIFTEHQIFRLE